MGKRATHIWPKDGLLLYDDKKECTAAKSRCDAVASQPMLLMKRWLSPSVEGAIESIGTPDWYRVAVGVGSQESRQNCSTRLAVYPNWFKWTTTLDLVKCHKKWMPKNHSVKPMKLTLIHSLRSHLKSFFDGWILSEIYKVVDIQAQGQQHGTKGFQGSQTNPV